MVLFEMYFEKKDLWIGFWVDIVYKIEEGVKDYFQVPGVSNGKIMKNTD